MAQITHQLDDHGHYIQIVTPAELRKILDRDGDDYARPDWMSDNDEWRVEDDDKRVQR